jgi:hypothetical protein
LAQAAHVCLASRLQRLAGLPDGRHKLIDGHLRRDFNPDMEVEVLDVTDDEARALLLRIDPQAELAASQEQLLARLCELTPAVSPDLKAL